MGRSIYLECNSGISGDMAVAMLLDLGADEAVLREALASLPLDGYEIHIGRREQNGIDCCDFEVILDEDNHDHDMEYLYAEGEAAEAHFHLHDHHHDHEHHEHESHDHDHPHDHHHHEHGAHTHRHLAKIDAILDAGNLTPAANALAHRIFRIIAEAESKAHRLPLDEVGFHEVGAVDSIVDITAFAVCFDNLGLDSVFVPKLCEGTGVVRCQHGLLPVPVPAVTNILAATDIPLEILPYQGEYVTPTGAAIVRATRTGAMPPAGFTIDCVGLGAGKRKSPRANILRGFLLGDTAEVSGQHETSSESIALWKLEADVDDSTGEALGYALECLLEAGARDAHYLPCYMKKNRPAYQLQVICDEEHRQPIEDIIFRETTTIGIRRMRLERTVLRRHIETVETRFGSVRVKVCEGGARRYFYPEYEDVAEIARRTGMPYRELHREIQAEAEASASKE
jgi:pyridinium-3,5-bisthiocarboxylic acid mononucleotide nickel chelatase